MLPFMFDYIALILIVNLASPFTFLCPDRKSGGVLQGIKAAFIDDNSYYESDTDKKASVSESA